MQEEKRRALLAPRRSFFAQRRSFFLNGDFLLNRGGFLLNGGVPPLFALLTLVRNFCLDLNSS
jgi:hypothetical protein